MANVFISHAGADSAAAEQVRQWLEQDGHHSYLDRHLVDGNLPGDEWEKRLFEELREADAVVCIVTEAYLGSVWCAAEIGAARALGSELLPLRFCSGEVFHPLLNPIHGVDAILDPEGTRERLALKLGVIDGTGGLGWPDDKSPYPGLRPFDLGEHRVFFGRNLDIQKIAEELRSPANRSRSILAVVGPSGCGKSSLVRAGVLPRIAGQRDWLPLAPMVPGIDPLPRLARELAAAARRLDVDVTPLRGDVSGDTIAKVANDLLLATDMDSQCKLLIVIDQFEELVTQTERAERAEFASALACAVGGPIQVLATLRPEFLDVVLTDPDLSELPLRVYPIRPLESDALRSVIEGPARIAGIGVEDGLVGRLVADTGSGDALPLLAYTLEQLAHGVTRGGQLEHQRYVDIGGVQGALARQADAALLRDTAHQPVHQPGADARDEHCDDRGHHGRNKHLGHQAGPDDAVPTDRGEHRADDAADQRVRRAGRQTEQPGEQVPDNAADQAGEHQLQRDETRVDETLCDRGGDRGRQERAHEVQHRRHRDGDLRLEGPAGDRRGHGVAGVVEAVREVEGERGDHHDDQQEKLKGHGADSFGQARLVSIVGLRIPW